MNSPMKELILATAIFAASCPAIAQSTPPATVENASGQATRTKSFELFRQGQKDFLQKNYPEAESNWKKAIELAPSENDNKSKAESMCGLAIVYTKQARVAETKKASDEAIEFITSKFGANDPRLELLKKLSEGASSACVAPSVDESGAEWMKHMQAGTDLMKSGDFTRAVSSFECALDIVDKTQPDSQVAAATLSPLAAAYLKSGDLKMAEATMKRALPLCKKYFADKPKLIEALQSELASVRAKQNQR